MRKAESGHAVGHMVSCFTTSDSFLKLPLGSVNVSVDSLLEYTARTSFVCLWSVTALDDNIKFFVTVLSAVTFRQ